MASRWANAATALTVVASAAWACADPFVGGESGSSIDFDRRALLASVAEDVVAPTLEEFSTTADALAAATDAYVMAVGTVDAEERRTEAQLAFEAAMDVWQRAEVMQLGPAGPSFSAVGGLDLGDEIYSWPTSSSCLVDQALVDRAYEAPDFVDTALVNVYGLDALEYLLFNDSPSNTCAGQLPINAGPWDALTEEELATRRAAYAAVVAKQVAGAAHSLAEAWGPSGDYVAWLSAPGEGGSPYESEAAAVDELLRVMFYVDSVLKDVKLARPAGIQGCGAEACPDEVESPWADRARQNAIANLEGLRQMYLGGPDDSGVGFDDFLVAAGAEDVAADMLADIEAAQDMFESMPPSFAEALAADPAALDPSYASVKQMTDRIKGPFTMALQLSVPAEAAGDAD